MIQKDLIKYPEQFAATLTRMQRKIDELERRVKKLENN